MGTNIHQQRRLLTCELHWECVPGGLNSLANWCRRLKQRVLNKEPQANGLQSRRRQRITDVTEYTNVGVQEGAVSSPAQH